MTMFGMVRQSNTVSKFDLACGDHYSRFAVWFRFGLARRSWLCFLFPCLVWLDVGAGDIRFHILRYPRNPLSHSKHKQLITLMLTVYKYTLHCMKKFGAELVFLVAVNWKFFCPSSAWDTHEKSKSRIPSLVGKIQ